CEVRLHDPRLELHPSSPLQPQLCKPKRAAITDVCGCGSSVIFSAYVTPKRFGAKTPHKIFNNPYLTSHQFSEPKQPSRSNAESPAGEWHFSRAQALLTPATLCRDRSA